jgi:hypothetical protein
MEKIDRNPGWYGNESWIIVQIDPIEYQPVSLEHLVEFETRKYGNTLLVFYETPSREDV